MSRIKQIEELLNSHVLFIYNNFKIKDAMIGYTILKEIYRQLQTMNKYDTITIFYHTRGGNLATGYKIMEMIKSKFSKINSGVIERSCSTGTFMALVGDKLYITPHALISPSEPQMDLFDEYGTSVSTSLIKNAIENKLPDISSYDIANYISTLKYYRRLCLDIYGEDKGTKIFDYMHQNIDSHQTPLTIRDLNQLVDTEYFSQELYDLLIREHNEMLTQLKSKYHDEKLTILKSGDLCLIEEIKYDADGKKIVDGYIEHVEGKEEPPMKDNPRINAILSERNQRSKTVEYVDASNWNDKYDDEPQYDDTYDDEPKWNDQYDDEAVVDEKVEKVRKLRKEKVKRAN